LLYAMVGRGRESLNLLGQAIEHDPNDIESMALALEWLFTLTREGKVVRSRAEDLQLARSYGTAYLAVGGPDEALVRRWVEYFEKQK